MKSIGDKKWVAAGLLIGVGLTACFLFRKQESPTPIQISPAPKVSAPIETQGSTNQAALLHGISKPYAQFTPEERAQLNTVFHARLKPVIEKWGAVYAGRIPFDIADVNLEKFHSRVDGGFYTFMLGDTTFTVLDDSKRTKVFYMMTKQAAKDLNTIPNDGRPRNLTIPVTREEVLKLAAADTGLHYELKDVVIQPSAVACNMDGGAFVEVGIKHENGMTLVLPDNLFFEVDSNGMIVSYQH